MKFILTIDTEGDNQWEHGRALTSENVRFVPRFQELCNRFSVKPTYLVTSEICEDTYAKMIFSDYMSNNLAEIGAHLHSWTTPPFLDKDGFRYNDPQHAYASEIPEELLEMKLQNITDQIESAFGKRPLSFRSGRYGFNEFVAQSLIRKKYLVDTSVTPYTDWTFNKGLSTGSGGPDFLEKTPYPYVYEFNEESLVEIPVTVLPVAFPLNKSRTIALHYFRNVDKSYFLKVLRKIFFKNQPFWLRPFDWVNIGMFETLLKEAIDIKLPYIVMMFHSSELMPGCSMYWKDTDAIDRLYGLLTDFFKLLQQKNIPSLTLTEAANDFVRENISLRR